MSRPRAAAREVDGRVAARPRAPAWLRALAAARAQVHADADNAHDDETSVRAELKRAHADAPKCARRPRTSPKRSQPMAARRAGRDARGHPRHSGSSRLRAASCMSASRFRAVARARSGAYRHPYRRTGTSRRCPRGNELMPLVVVEWGRLT